MNMAVWDERLIGRHRAADLAGQWDVTVDNDYYLRCVQCDGNITLLPTGGRRINVDGVISAVLGHMVKCHEYTLSGADNGQQAG